MHDQKVPNDLVMEIISHLPLKFAVRCKVLSKNFNSRISDPKFCQTLSQHQKISALLNSSLHGRIYEILQKISVNRTAASHSESSILPVKAIHVLATSKGLILVDFYKFANYCVFNPITGAYQLIPYPDTEEFYWKISPPGFVVDYPNSDQYMLVTVTMIDESYVFKVFSSIGSGVWREFQLGIINPDLYVKQIRPVYVHDCFHWIRGEIDGGPGVLAFHTKKMEAIFIDFPELNIDYENFMCRKWLGVSHGLLTLVCTPDNSIVISSYDYATNKWSISHNVTNFIMGLDYYNYSFPIWIDSEHEFFLVEHDHDHDFEMKRYQITPALVNEYFSKFSFEFYAFTPSLASVHTMLSHAIHPKHLSSITATLARLRRFITNSSS